MPPKNQHFVPRVYLKNWESEQCMEGEPQKGVFVFDKKTNARNKKATDSILSNNHTYTISFDYSFIAARCPAVRDDFGAAISKLLDEEGVSVWCDGTALNTPKQLSDNMHLIDSWQMKYSDSLLQAPEKKIRNMIQQLRSYVLEDKFSERMENLWQRCLDNLICYIGEANEEVESGVKLVIPKEMSFMLIDLTLLMLIRNPIFDGFGVFPQVDRLVFDGVMKPSLTEAERNNLEKARKEQLRGLWLAEVYRALFQEEKGTYANVYSMINDRLNLIIFGIRDDVYDTFLTSDNPCFVYINNVSRENRNAIYFPLCPKLLLVFGRGACDIESIEYKMLDRPEILNMNRIIANNASKYVISCKRRMSI